MLHTGPWQSTTAICHRSARSFDRSQERIQAPVKASLATGQARGSDSEYVIWQIRTRLSAFKLRHAGCADESNATATTSGGLAGALL
jgi:hypothetical protein